MKPATLDAIKKTRAEMIRKYPGYLDLPNGERVLLCMAYLCDAVKVKELWTNRGFWVEVFLDSAGVAPGNPWCASALTFACKVAEVETPGGSALVKSWMLWFRRRDKDETLSPQRGMVAMHDAGNGKGHIGIVVRVVGPFVYSIEGNTGSGPNGSQRDGDGMYRRTRLKRFWSWGFGEL